MGLLFYKTLFKEEQVKEPHLCMWAVCQLTKRLNTAVDEIVQAGSFGEMSQRHHHSELGDLGPEPG